MSIETIVQKAETALEALWQRIVHLFHTGSLPTVVEGQPVTLPPVNPAVTTPPAPALPVITPVAATPTPVATPATPAVSTPTPVATPTTTVTDPTTAVKSSDFGTPDSNGFAVCHPLETLRAQIAADGHASTYTNIPLMVCAPPVAALIPPGADRVKADWMISQAGWQIAVSGSIANPLAIAQGFAYTMVVNPGAEAAPDSVPQKWGHPIKGAPLPRCFVYGSGYTDAASIVAAETAKYQAWVAAGCPVESTGPSAFIGHN